MERDKVLSGILKTGIVPVAPALRAPLPNIRPMGIGGATLENAGSSETPCPLSEDLVAGCAEAGGIVEAIRRVRSEMAIPPLV